MLCEGTTLFHGVNPPSVLMVCVTIVSRDSARACTASPAFRLMVVRGTIVSLTRSRLRSRRVVRFRTRPRLYDGVCLSVRIPRSVHVVAHSPVSHIHDFSHSSRPAAVLRRARAFAQPPPSPPDEPMQRPLSVPRFVVFRGLVCCDPLGRKSAGSSSQLAPVYAYCVARPRAPAVCRRCGVAAQ